MKEQRIIKFRAISMFIDDWVYGFLSYDSHMERWCIIDDDNSEWVHYETIGQFTGLTNKDGLEIYEGDIVESNMGIGKVIFFQPYAAFRIEHDLRVYQLNEGQAIKIIGNIHQHPELLKP